MVDNLFRVPRGRIRPHAPGAGWLLAFVYVLCAFVFTAWLTGWGENRGRIAAPTASHHATTTGSGGSQSQ